MSHKSRLAQKIVVYEAVVNTQNYSGIYLNFANALDSVPRQRFLSKVKAGSEGGVEE